MDFLVIIPILYYNPWLSEAIMPTQRLDSLLVSLDLAENKNKARALIMAGKVSVNRKIIIKAGTLIKEEAYIELAQKPLYVSRGGNKLSHALDEF